MLRRSGAGARKGGMATSRPSFRNARCPCRRAPLRLRTVDVMRLVSSWGLRGCLPGVSSWSCGRGGAITHACAIQGAAAGPGCRSRVAAALQLLCGAGGVCECTFACRTTRRRWVQGRHTVRFAGAGAPAAGGRVQGRRGGWEPNSGHSQSVRGAWPPVQQRGRPGEGS